MLYHILADLVVAIHVAYVGYVIVGQLAIFAGALLRWKWIRNPWFRWTHLLMMSIVGFEAAADITCPLTSWEDSLRGGALAGEGTFVGRLLHDLLFIDASPGVIRMMHVCFALLVIGTFVLAPPRFSRERAPTAEVAAVTP